MAHIDTSFWCERVQLCFSMFQKNPHTLQHLLLFGPPGSGKTTSAAWLVDQIWKNRKSMMCISMNAADERSLESIRQKVFPFLRMDWRLEEEKAPRFLILDECETLTEAAQLSLQTILNLDPKEICVILICNSQSRIHPKLRQRLLKIRYDPPQSAGPSSDLMTSITRGDLRQQMRRSDMEQRISSYLHCHPSEIFTLLRENTYDHQTLLTELLLLSDACDCLDLSLLERIHQLYPFLEQTDLPPFLEAQMEQLIRDWKQKMERSLTTSI